MSVGMAALGGCNVGFGGGPDDDSGTAEATPATTFTTNDDWQAPSTAPADDVSAHVLVENLEIPWDIAVAPDGDLFVTERTGRVNRFSAGDIETVVTPGDAIDAGALDPDSDERPWWVEGGEGGTLGVAVHPLYPDYSFVYVYYTATVDDEIANRVSRFDVSLDEPAASETVLVDGIPASNIHNGGRITFGPDGYLWVTVGDAGEGQHARDLGVLGGSVLRLQPNGEPAPDNPELGDAADPRIFTSGHRNPQGLVWLPDGTPVASEHGPTGRDEVNRLVGGADYGWPDVRDADAYRQADDVHPPLLNTGRGTAWAPTGSRFYTGDAVPSWRNRMLIGGLGSQQVVVVTLTPPGQDLPPADDGRRFADDWFDDAYTATAHTVLKNELGRVRHLEQGPNGELYAVTSNRDGRAKQPFPRENDDVLVRIDTN